MDPALLDTDILSELLKQRNPSVRTNAAAYLKTHGQFTMSAFTRFEVSRGYKEKQATTFLTRFDTFCRHSLILPVTEAVLDQAGDLWSTARRGGHSHYDADLIIVATAIEAGRTLVSGNTAHFSWIPGLKLEDWRQP